MLTCSQSAGPAPAGADDLATLRELNRKYVCAAETSDVHWYEENLDECYMCSNPDGSLADRAGFLARIARPYPGSHFESVDPRIRLVGELGIVQSGFKRLRADGQVEAGCYTDVWMRRGGRWLCISAHFVMFNVAQAPAGREREAGPGDRAPDHAVLDELNRNFIRSVRESDARWFDVNLDEDFVNSNPDGSLSERTAFLAQIARPCAVANLDAEDVRIRIIGDVAIIHGRTVYVKPGGEPGAGRYTDVWLRRQGRWLCVSAHVTRG